jgi:hypothetical protein
MSSGNIMIVLNYVITSSLPLTVVDKGLFSEIRVWIHNN